MLRIKSLQHTFTLFILAIITPLIYSRLLANGTDLPRFKLITLLVTCSAIFFLFLFYKRSKLTFNKLFFIPFIIFIWSVISLLWSIDIGNSLIQLPYFFSSLLILFLAMQIRFYKQQKFIINGAIVGCFLVALIGLLQAFNFNPFNIHYNSLPASTFINKNHASMYVEFFAPVLLILLLYKNSVRSKIFYSIVLTLSLSFLYILSTFGSYISLFLSLTFSGVMLAKNANLLETAKKNYKYLAAIFISTILVTTSFSLIVQQAEIEPFTSITEKNTHKQRLALYEKTLGAIKDEPVAGFGYGAFRAAIVPYIAEVQAITKHNENTFYREAHNDYLQQFTETGIISGLLFFFFFLLIIYSGLNSIKNKKISEKNIFIFSISTGLLVLFLHAFIDFPFYLSASNFLIYLTAGFILSTTAKNKVFHKTFLLKTSIFLIFIFLFTFLITTTHYNIKHIKSNKLIRDAAIALHKEGNCNKSIALIDESNQLFKFDFQSQKSQAFIYKLCPQEREKQRKVIENLIKLSPSNFRARFLRGNLYLLENKSNLAFKEFYYILSMLPNRAIGYIGMANWAAINHKYKDARIYLEKAKSLEPYREEDINAKLDRLPPLP